MAELSTVATNTALTAWGSASNFLVVLVLLGVLFVFAQYVGRGPFVALLLAFYAAYAVYAFFPYIQPLSAAPSTASLATHLALYAALTFAFFMILRRVIVSDFLYISNIGLIVLSFLGAAFLLALGYHVFSIASAYHFTPAVAALFAPGKYFFWWFSAPAIGLFFFAR